MLITHKTFVQQRIQGNFSANGEWGVGSSLGLPIALSLVAARYGVGFKLEQFWFAI